MAEDTDKAKSGNRKIVLLAALAGILAGIVAVYVMGRLSGNEVAGENSVNNKPVAAATSTNSAQCPIKAEALKALDAAATGGVAAMRAADNPISVADLAFKGPNGEAMTLGSFKGKTLLVNLWATWCAPCREEMPALDKLQAERGGNDFEVVAINIDTGSDEKPKKFLDEIGVKNLTLHRDASMASFNELRRKNLAVGLPVTLLVDRNGCQIAAMNGPAPWESPEAFKLIDAAKGL